MTAALPRQSASLVVVRAAPGGLELLLMERADKGDHNSGAWVFPGGLVDAGDRDGHSLCDGLDDTRASELLDLPHGGLDFYVAAIRECFEESGLLFARPTAAQRPDRSGRDFTAECRALGLRLAAAQLSYIAHWITPVGMTKRFDTRFFVAVLPEGQDSQHDAVETVDHVWMRPALLLAPGNTRRLLKVTHSIIQTLAAFDSVDALLAWASAPRVVPLVLQRRCTGPDGIQSVMPDHSAWAELGLLDPLGEGNFGCELRPGVAVQLSPRLRRVAPGVADVAAGNVYLVGSDAAGWAALPVPQDGQCAVLPGGIVLQPVYAAGHGWIGYFLADENMLVVTGGIDTPLPADSLPTSLLARLQWIAPRRGFLIPVGPGHRGPLLAPQAIPHDGHP